MAQLRSRSSSKDASTITVKTIKKTTIQKKSASNMKSIVQTFTAIDTDVETNHEYPKTQAERGLYVNFKTGKKVTPFQYRVYDLTLQIPKGQVTSYKALSDALQSAPRAVGQALRLNPFAPLPVPCHRVIATDYSLGGFAGGSGDHQKTANKKAKLQAEGCVFEEHYIYKHDANGSKDFFTDFKTV